MFAFALQRYCLCLIYANNTQKVSLYVALKISASGVQSLVSVPLGSVGIALSDSERARSISCLGSTFSILAISQKKLRCKISVFFANTQIKDKKTPGKDVFCLDAKGI